MTDPWQIAARKIQAQRAGKERVAAEEAAAERATKLEAQENQRRAYEQRRDAMRAAIAAGTAQLHEFLAARGEAARELLAAKGKFILFGSDSEGGTCFSVYLDETGLVKEVGSSGWYGKKPPPRKEVASVERAVEAFAYDGEGEENPEKVRDIVTWLTKKLNYYLPDPE